MMKRAVISLMPLGVVLGCGMDLEEPLDEASRNQQAAGLDASAIYAIRAAHSGLYLDVRGARLADATPVIQWTHHGRDNQLFEAHELDDGAFQLVGVQSGKCLTVSDDSTANGAPLEIHSCADRPGQRFTITSHADDSHLIRAAHSQRCLDVSGASSEAGAQIIQWNCHQRDNQRFFFEPAQGGGDDDPDELRYDYRVDTSIAPFNLDAPITSDDFGTSPSFDDPELRRHLRAFFRYMARERDPGQAPFHGQGPRGTSIHQLTAATAGVNNNEPVPNPDRPGHYLVSDNFGGRGSQARLLQAIVLYGMVRSEQMLDEIHHWAEIYANGATRRFIDPDTGQPIEGGPGDDGEWKYLFLGGGGAGNLHGTTQKRNNQLAIMPIIAHLTYIFDVNRDVKPAYAQTADRLLEISQSWERHWARLLRGDSSVYPPYHRANQPTDMHNVWTMIRYNHYMYLLTGEQKYRDEREHLVGERLRPNYWIWRHDDRSVYAWEYTVSPGFNANHPWYPFGAQQMVYTNIQLMSFLDLELAGVPTLQSQDAAQMLCRTVARVVFYRPLEHDRPFAPDNLRGNDFGDSRGPGDRYWLGDLPATSPNHGGTRGDWALYLKPEFVIGSDLGEARPFYTYGEATDTPHNAEYDRGDVLLSWAHHRNQTVVHATKHFAAEQAWSLFGVLCDDDEVAAGETDLQKMMRFMEFVRDDGSIEDPDFPRTLGNTVALAGMRLGVRQMLGIE